MRGPETARERTARLAEAAPTPSLPELATQLQEAPTPASEPSGAQRLAYAERALEDVALEATELQGRVGRAEGELACLRDSLRPVEEVLKTADSKLTQLLHLLETVPALVDRATRMVNVLESAHAAHQRQAAQRKPAQRKKPAAKKSTRSK